VEQGKEAPPNKKLSRLKMTMAAFGGVRTSSEAPKEPGKSTGGDDPPGAPKPILMGQQLQTQSTMQTFDSKASMETTASATYSAPRLSPDMCLKQAAGRFKLKWQPHTDFRRLWTTSGHLEEQPVSFWVPTDLVPRGKLKGARRGSHAVKERLALGHYASAFFGAPTEVQILEVTDERHSGIFVKHNRQDLQKFLDLYFPHPVRFRKIWQRNATSPVHIWEPIPPANEYVALGLVATVDEDAPLLTEIRCVPRPWAERTGELRTVWTGIGANGAPAQFWAGATTSDGHLRATAGAGAEIAPEAYTMATEKFYANLPCDRYTVVSV